MLDRRRLLALAGASALAAVLPPRSSGAQANWPNRFVRLIVPFPPGGGTDAIARVVVGQALRRSGATRWWSRTRAAAPPTSAPTSSRKAEPDGYTVLLQSVPLAVNKFLFATLPFDPVADLAPVSLICDYPNVMAVPMSLAGEDGAGVHRPRQGQSRQGHLCVVRPRHLGASVRRAVQAHGRRRHAARALSRRRAGAQRSDPRPRRRDVQQHRRGRCRSSRAASCARSA